MTNEQIIQWAREAGAELNVFARMRVGGVLFAEYELARFAELVAAATREECAALHDSEDVLAPVGNSAWGEAYQEGWINGTAAYRDAIRAMNKGTTT